MLQIEDEKWDSAIRKATRAGSFYGGKSFADGLEYELNCRIRAKKVGRPRKEMEEC